MLLCCVTRALCASCTSIVPSPFHAVCLSVQLISLRCFTFSVLNTRNIVCTKTTSIPQNLIKSVRDLTTHHRLLHVNLFAAGEAKVCNLCHQVVPYQNIPGCQVPVDELMETE